MMSNSMQRLNKGDFVKIGNDTGVIIFLEVENNTPNKHVGIWYGETNEQGHPKYRTVPIEYCTKIDKVECYH